MHVTDLFVIVVLLLGAYLGSRKDLTQSLYQGIRLAGTCIVSLLYYQNMTDWLLLGEVLSRSVAEFLSFIFISLTCYFGFTLVIFLLNAIVEIKFVSVIERPMGLLVGTVNVLFLTFWLFLLLLLFPLPVIRKTLVHGSLTGKISIQILDLCYPAVTERFPYESDLDVSSLRDAQGSRLDG